MKPIKTKLLQNILALHQNNPEKYTSYLSSTTLNPQQLAKELDRFIATNIEI
jgi:hypothetical protein